MIRDIEEKDLTGLNCLHENLFKQSFDFEHYVSSPGFNYGKIIEVDGEVLGYLVAQIIFENSDLYYVAVAPMAKRCGYGAQLMRAYFEDCKVAGVEDLSLEVRVSNEAAISLYKKYGYAEIGTRSRYYADGEDALLMILNIKNMSRD